MGRSYGFDLIIRHSNELCLATRRNFKIQMTGIRDGFSFLDKHFRDLEKESISLSRNVKLALTARFTNHLLSSVLLCERGLILDAFNCSRSGIETTAFYWLVCVDADAAELYQGERSPPPVEVRKRLEGLGIDVAPLREHYALESAIAHVGNEYDNLQIRWEHGRKGNLLVGGGSSPIIQKAMLEAVPSAIARFVMHDNHYIVTVAADQFDLGRDPGAVV